MRPNSCSRFPFRKKPSERKDASRNPIRRDSVWLPMPGKFSVARTVYSLGLSGDHRLTGPNPVRLSRAVLVPGEPAVTAMVCAAICR